MTPDSGLCVFDLLCVTLCVRYCSVMESQNSESSLRFAAGTTPHTSISELPQVPTEGSTRNRRRSEAQELRNRVELLGTKVMYYHHVNSSSSRLHNSYKAEFTALPTECCCVVHVMT